MVGTVKKVKLHHYAKFLHQSVKPLLRYGDLSIFQDGSRSRHLGFSNFQNFNG